jgi:hypothetical protein
MKLCWPGSAVTVERIFSGGHDPIAIRSARLKPVKQQLKLARVVHDLLSTNKSQVLPEAVHMCVLFNATLTSCTV